MINKTYIKGKDLDLETSISTMLNKLKKYDFSIKEISSLNPTEFAYSHHIQEETTEFLFTNGKGACVKSSMASALGEFFERLCTNYFFADYYLGEDISKSDFVFYPNEKWFSIDSNETPLTDELWSFYDEDDELSLEDLYELNSGSIDRGICALPFRCVLDDEVVYFPVNILNNLYVSNGMAAGNTANEAKVQGLSEILERYVKNKIISEGISLPDIPIEVLDLYVQSKNVIQKLEDYGYHIKVQDASLGGIYPVICVTLINPKDGSVFASFGSHPCFEVALERTVTELLQGRSLDMFNDFKTPSFDLFEVADAFNLEDHFVNSTGLISYEFFKNSSKYSFVHWNKDLNTKDEFEYLSKIIYKMNLDMYIAEYNFMDVNICRIIIPGMSEIYPVSDLLFSNNNIGMVFREKFLNLNNLTYEDMYDLLEDLADSGLDDMRKVSELIGIIPDKNTLWESIILAEIKAMLCIATKDYEDAIEFNNVVLAVEVDAKRIRFYKCLQAVLEIKIDMKKDFKQYEYSLVLMYSQENVDICLKLISGDKKFYGLESPTLSLSGLEKHSKLIDAYKKLARAKREYYGK